MVRWSRRLSAIALDTDDPEPDTIDYNIAKELFPYSSWRDKNFEKAIHKLDKRLTKAKKDLDRMFPAFRAIDERLLTGSIDLDVRDLLRRDWKGDMVHSRDSNATHKGQGINVGYASIPGVSLHEMVDRTESQTIEEYFECVWCSTPGIKARLIRK